MLYSPTFNSHLHKHQSVFFQMVPRYMHILGSVPELQTVRFGYVFRRKLHKVGGELQEVNASVAKCLCFTHKCKGIKNMYIKIYE